MSKLKLINITCLGVAPFQSCAFINMLTFTLLSFKGHIESPISTNNMCSTFLDVINICKLNVFLVTPSIFLDGLRNVHKRRFVFPNSLKSVERCG